MQLVLGTAQVDPSYGIARNLDSCNPIWEEIFAEAAGNGFNALDTASLYPGAHEVIGASSWEGEIHTKVASVSSAAHDLRIAKEKLGREELDVVYFHRLTRGDKSEQNIRDSARELLQSGARAVGVTIYDITEFEFMLEMEEISHVQIPLNALDQRFLGRPLETLQKYGKKIIARSILLQGILVAPEPVRSRPRYPLPLIEQAQYFQNEATDAGLTPLQLAISFVKSLSGINGVVLGSESVNQVRELGSAWRHDNEDVAKKIDFEKFSVSDESALDPRSWLG